MGRGRSKAGGGSAQNATATASTTPVANVPTNAVAITDSDAAQLRAQQDSMYDANTTAAVKMYISNTDFDGDRHSLSQTMNYLLDEGVDFNNIQSQADLNKLNRKYGLHLSAGDIASMQYTNDYMAAAVHSIGKDVKLQRGAHDGLLQRVFGIQDYSKMSDKQLSAALVGQSFRTTSFMSTSYDVKKNPFLSSSSGVSGGREVVFNIKAGKNTRMLFGAKSQSEIVIGKGTDFKITGVRYTGKTATPRGGRSKPQIEIDIETF